MAFAPRIFHVFSCPYNSLPLKEHHPSATPAGAPYLKALLRIELLQNRIHLAAVEFVVPLNRNGRRWGGRKLIWSSLSGSCFQFFRFSFVSHTSNGRWHPCSLLVLGASALKRQAQKIKNQGIVILTTSILKWMPGKQETIVLHMKEALCSCRWINYQKSDTVRIAPPTFFVCCSIVG